LDDKDTISTKLRILINDIENSNIQRHKESYIFNYPLQIFEHEKYPNFNSFKKNYLTKLSPINNNISDSIHILSFDTIFDNKENTLNTKTIFRVQNLFELNESKKYSKTEYLNFKNIFKNLNIKNLNLTKLSTMNNIIDDININNKENSNNNNFELNPMEIKTFIIQFYNKVKKLILIII
jgi:hypothetical protein